eukprot:6053343-Pyramimonas_sp.AAC.1
MMMMIMTAMMTMVILGARHETNSRDLDARGHKRPAGARRKTDSRDLEARGHATCQQALGTRLNREIEARACNLPAQE